MFHQRELEVYSARCWVLLPKGQLKLPPPPAFPPAQHNVCPQSQFATHRDPVTSSPELTRWFHLVKIPPVPFISLITPGLEQVGLVGRGRQIEVFSYQALVERNRPFVCLLSPLCPQGFRLFKRDFHCGAFLIQVPLQ